MSQINNPSKIPTQFNNGVHEVTCEDLHKNLNSLIIIDVRGSDEFSGELGHIEGAKLVTLGPELTQFLQKANKNQEMVFVCRSGGRSHRATTESLQMGFKSSYNMQGGMMRWNALKLPTQR